MKDKSKRNAASQRTQVAAGEMELLSLLWEHGPLSLSEAHERIGRTIGDKQLASREKVGRQPTRYAAAIEPNQVGAGHLDQLVQQVTHGRVVPLVAHLVENAQLSAEELDELKQLVETAERRTRQANGDQPSGGSP